VLATFAQFERRLISQRTRDALAVKRAQGVQLGRRRELADAIVARIVAERTAGSTLAAIAERLTAEQVPTAHGGARWWPSTVRAVVAASAR
jgi:DNA invertase Pin-like site-specific DNA recombinase